MSIADAVAGRNLATGLYRNVLHFFGEEKAEIVKGVVTHVNFFDGGFPMDDTSLYKYAKKCPEVEHFLFMGDDAQPSVVLHLGRFEYERPLELLLETSVISRPKSLLVSRQGSDLIYVDTEYADIHKIVMDAQRGVIRVELPQEELESLQALAATTAETVDTAWALATGSFEELVVNVFETSRLVRDSWRECVGEWSLLGFNCVDAPVDAETLMLSSVQAQTVLVSVLCGEQWLLLGGSSNMSGRARMLGLALWDAVVGSILAGPELSPGLVCRAFVRGEEPLSIADMFVLDRLARAMKVLRPQRYIMEAEALHQVLEHVERLDAANEAEGGATA